MEPELTPAPLRLRPWRDDAVALSDRLRTQEGRVPRAVVDGSAGELLGSVTVHSIDPRQGTAQIGYRTASPARGRGEAPTAVDAACCWAFGALGVERVELCHAAENAAAGRVAEGRASATRAGCGGRSGTATG